MTIDEPPRPHPGHHAPVLVPPGWRCTCDPGGGVLLRVRAPHPGLSGVVPLLRLDIEPVRVSWRAWREDDLADLAARRTDFALAEEDEYEQGVRDVGFRRYTYRRGVDVLVCEQWAWLVEGVGHTLTGTAAHEDLDAVADVFAVVAGSFDPGRPVAA